MLLRFLVIKKCLKPVRAFKEKYQELAQRAGETGEMPSSTSPEEVIHVQGEVIDDGYEIGDD